MLPCGYGAEEEEGTWYGGRLPGPPPVPVPVVKMGATGVELGRVEMGADEIGAAGVLETMTVEVPGTTLAHWQALANSAWFLQLDAHDGTRSSSMPRLSLRTIESRYPPKPDNDVDWLLTSQCLPIT